MLIWHWCVCWEGIYIAKQVYNKLLHKKAWSLNLIEVTGQIKVKWNSENTIGLSIIRKKVSFETRDWKLVLAKESSVLLNKFCPNILLSPQGFKRSDE